ncbi:MAG TPA: helix-turn-helix domain-containing protein [Rhodocyclaceae bacterium]|nr:helix-turn-helix domain-containing protein [Thiobacillaceae bacterium]HNE44235.1 helix-turn-helix domain-containing protein [Rhodocyclaceae bacterium]HNG04560.1 helix-turn-helix domain-containing protein [Nitrospira sp.]
MSVRTLARVWEFSRHSGTHLLMMLAIADFADDDGRAYPAVGTLAKKCRMSSRNVNLILAELRKSHELIVKANQGPRGTNLYIIPVLPPEASFTPEARFTLKPTSPTPEAGFPKPLKPTSDKPSLNRHEPSISDTDVSLVGIAADVKAGKRRVPVCPHHDIIDLYHEALPTSPRIRDWTPARAAHLRARWNEDPARQNLDYWRRFFAYVAESYFLTGRTSSLGRKPFHASLEWLAKAENFAKVREGRYHSEGNA